jgi:hypothetical protein
MKDLGPLSMPLGMGLEYNKELGTCTLHQAALIRDLISDKGLRDSNPRILLMDPNENFYPTPSTEEPVPKEECNYLAIVGSLLHLMNCTRPDIAEAVNMLCRFTSRPGPTQCAALKGVLLYLKGTMRLGITYSPGDSTIQGWFNAHYGGDLKIRKSTTGYVFTCNHGPVSWSSKLLPTVAQSTTKAEFMAAGAACKDALWWRKTQVDYSLSTKPISIITDNQSSLAIIKNGATSNATKHIDIVHHATHDAVVAKKVSFDYTPTEVMAADYLTKPCPTPKFKSSLKQIGMPAMTPCNWHPFSNVNGWEAGTMGFTQLVYMETCQLTNLIQKRYHLDLAKFGLSTLSLVAVHVNPI